MSQEIVLYDLPSSPPCRSWSGNAWKTRLVLNFKGIPYKTEWIPYTRLQETLKATGLKPNPPGSFSEYSVPTIRLPDGSYIMDSAAIAIKLESLYPTPPLHLNPELEKETQAGTGAMFMALVMYFCPMAVNGILAEEDKEWWKADRARRFGTTTEELMTPKDADAAYAAAKPGFEQCREVLRKHKKDEGPFILGSVPCYADFYMAATLTMFSQCSEEEFARFMKEAGPEMRDQFEACKKWTVKQD